MSATLARCFGFFVTSARSRNRNASLGRSTKVAKAGKGKLKITGDLNMRGVSKSVVLEVESKAAKK